MSTAQNANTKRLDIDAQVQVLVSGGPPVFELRDFKFDAAKDFLEKDGYTTIDMIASAICTSVCTHALALACAQI